jgi:hypothetical protein
MPDPTAPRFSKSIVKVTLLTTDPSTDEVQPVVYYSKNPQKKRGPKALRPLERLARFDAETRKAVVDDYLDRHNRSSERKKNGWLRDMGKNVFRSIKTGRKRLKELDEDDVD